MKIQIIDVTPELATKWLSQNPKNRNLNDKLVADYLRAIVNDDWALNGEAIKRDVYGNLLDGQHRLMAVKLSGKTVTMLVIEDLDPSLQDTMDAGRKRTMGDVLAISGETNALQLATIARRVWMWDRGGFKFPSSPTPSVTELRAVLDQYPTLRRSAEIGSRTAVAFRATKSSVTGTAHHIFLQIDQDLTAEFFAQLSSGAGLDTGHPVLALRNRIIQDKLTSKKVPFHLGVALHIRAWNGLREGRELSRLIHTADEPMIKPV